VSDKLEHQYSFVHIFGFLGMETRTRRRRRGRAEQRIPTIPQKKQKHCHHDAEEPEIPQWFLENCVKTAEELAAFKVPLIIREDLFVSHETRQELDVPILDTYEVVSAVYDPLLEILTGGPLVHDSYPNGTKFFKNDAVHLRFPAKGRPRGGIQFLTMIVEHFAQDVKVDLIRGTHDYWYS
jgi:hypothetical protein